MPLTSMEELGPGAWELLPVNSEGQRVYLVFDSDTVGAEAARGLAVALLSQPRETTASDAQVAAQHFMDCLRRLLIAGGVWLEDDPQEREAAPTPTIDLKIGRVDVPTGRVFLEPHCTLFALEHRASEFRLEIPATRRAWGQILQEAGVLRETGRHRPEVLKSFEGGAYWCWVLDLETVYGE